MIAAKAMDRLVVGRGLGLVAAVALHLLAASGEPGFDLGPVECQHQQEVFVAAVFVVRRVAALVGCLAD